MPKKSQIIVPPKNGWKQNTWYLVEVAFHQFNPIFGALFFSGFLNNGIPSGYNEIAGLEDKNDINDVVYMRAIKELISVKEMNESDNIGKTLGSNLYNINNNSL